MEKNSLKIYIIILFCLGLITVISAAPTTEVKLTRYAADGFTILDEKTVDFHWMEANLPVLGDGATHYHHQGPVFEGDRWNPEEDTNVLERDMGAVKGTDLRDLCNLIGGVSEGETVTLRASDGLRRTFPYGNIYHPEPRQGPMGITWYHAEDGYVPDYRTGMRLIFFADTSTNPWGVHAFGVSDMRAAFPEEYWYYFNGIYPTTTGLSVQYISEIIINSNQEPTGSIMVTSYPEGALIVVDDMPTGYTTPAMIDSIEVGYIPVRVELEGYASPDDAWVRIAAKQTEQIHFDLLRQSGYITIRSTPSNATIILNDNSTGKQTPATLENIPVGEQNITLMLKGYENVTEMVVVEDDYEELLFIALHVRINTTETVHQDVLAANQTGIPSPTIDPLREPPSQNDIAEEKPEEWESGFFAGIIDFFQRIIHFFFGTADDERKDRIQQENRTENDLHEEPAIDANHDRDLQRSGIIRPNRTGGVYIESHPPGAKILINNRETNQITPSIVYGLREGAHTISLALPSSSEGSTRADDLYGRQFVWVYPDSINTIRIDGIAPTRTRTITLVSDEYEGKSFTVNGRYPAYTIPATVEIKGAQVFIVLNIDDEHYSMTLPDKINDGETFVISKPESRLYSVHIASSPEGASIFVNGNPTGHTTPATIEGLSEGEHRFLLSNPGYIPAEGTIRIYKGMKGDSAGVIRSSLQPYTSGSLRVESDPPGARIFLYERFTGERTPHTFTDMRIGTYSVKLVWDDGKEKIRDVTVMPGEISLCMAHNGDSQ
ncbi:PEGA domain-containing protein [Methanocalculus chunghsingensis]|uniref:PEGA domain-containing protein n=1 Tax=Methanocalculus chunghsingensis TaxID=156457 RepID=UPI001B8BA21A|nr:PEGA domain-containing protein [Methanocalculus chunghsingensis]